MPPNFEQLSNNSDSKKKEREKHLMLTKRLEDLAPGTDFFIKEDSQIKHGRLVGVITKDKSVKENVEITWPDSAKSTGVERIEGSKLVQVKELPKEEPELEETILGEANPRQTIYIKDPKTGEKTRIRIISKLSKGSDVKVLINGRKKPLPWNTPVFIDKEKEAE